METITVEINLPPETNKLLDAIVKNGLLGDTRDEVIAHILRQDLFDKAMKNSERKA